MNLLRALHSEALKLKRTIALKVVVLAPALVVLLTLLVYYLMPYPARNRGATRIGWMSLERSALNLWALLMLPLYITLETALVAGLDHTDNQWKSLFARPVPRWTFYVAKLMVVAAMAVASTLALLCGILIDGFTVPWLRPDLPFGPPVPWGMIFRDSAQVAGLAFLAIAIQHWISLRWRSFSVAVGLGVVATIFGGFAFATGQLIGGWPQYFPWALPLLPLSTRTHNLGAALLIGAAAGLVVMAAGCLEFCRHEVN